MSVDALTRELAKASDLARAEGAKLLTRQVVDHRREVVRGFRGYDGTPGDKLQNRSGALRRSIDNEFATPASLRAATFSRGVPYAAIQETGGTVKPRRGKYLTVPMRGALTNAGVVRKAARPVRGSSGWETAGLVPGAADRRTFILDRGRGPRIYVRGSDGRLLPLWTLKKQVRIEGRLGFMDAWDNLEERRRRQFRQFLGRLFGGGFA